MTNFPRDSIVKAIHDGIKGDIRLLLENERLRGALLLTLSGIDTMAFLGMPESQDDVTKSDFVAWADTYIKFPCDEQITGLELYAARCAALHAYGTESRLSREGRCRQIIWMSEAKPDIIYRPDKHPGIVVVAIPSLAQAFFAGVDRFLVNMYSDPSRSKLADRRFNKIMHQLPGPGHETIV